MTRLTIAFVIGLTLMWGVLGTWEVMISSQDCPRGSVSAAGIARCK